MNKLNECINKNIKIFINENNIKRKWINKIHKLTKPFTSHIYSDYNWENAIELLGEINSFVSSEGNGSMNTWVEGTGYWKHIVEFPNYKEYKFSIEIEGVFIRGSLKCHAAGTINDPFGKYDMTVELN